MGNSFHIASLVTPALDGIVHALSDRGNQTEARRRAKADAAVTLILAFQPADVIEMTLAGQTILFNELLADGARDVLHGMVDATKERSLSSLVSMGRLVQGHLDRLERRGNRPYRVEAAAPQDGAQPEPAARPGDDRGPERLIARLPRTTVETPPPGAVFGPIPDRTAAPEQVDTGDGMPSGDPAPETSWLDEPYEQWLIETPADLAARAGVAQKPKGLAVVERAGGTGGVRYGRMHGQITNTAEPALPRRPMGYSPSRNLMDAASGD